MSHIAFIGTRARLQRLTDARFFAGWVKDFGKTDVRILAAGDFEISAGEQFMCQLSGKGANAIFKAQLGFTTGRNLHFRIISPIKVTASAEAVRISVEGMMGTIKGEESDISVRVMDVSELGAGIVSETKFERGATLEFAFESPGGMVNGTAEVRYCKPDPEFESHFRTGLHLTIPTRVDQARWHKMLEREEAA